MKLLVPFYNNSRLGPEGLEKTYIGISNNTFPIDMGLIKLFYFIVYGEFHLFIKILNFNDCLVI